VRTPTDSAVAILIAALAAVAPAHARDQAPSWLQSLAAVNVDTLAHGSDAVVLLDETRYEVAPDGRQKVTTRYAVRVLTASGREEASASDFYYPDGGNGGEQHAWLVRPSGTVTETRMIHGEARRT